jgi:serine/threonine protein kinase
MDLSGRTLSGRYEILDRLGQGGMGQVYHARDVLLGRLVALKVLWPHLAASEAAQERFRREARAAARLNHPAVVAVYDHGADEDLQFLVMEHVEGRTLKEMLAEEGPLTPDRAVAVAIGLADALAAAHAAGIVHRDIKPGNVIVCSDGSVKVMDFGIARAVTAETVSETAAVVGTAAYLSPEQAAGGRVDARTDLYALGVVLYEMLVGEPPFTGETPVAVAYKHLHDEPLPPSERSPGIPRPLDRIVARAMAKDPDERYGSAEDMRQDLDRIFGHQTDTERLVPEWGDVAEAVSGRPAHPWRWVLIALLLLGLAISVPLLAGGGSTPEDLDIEERPLPSVPATASPRSGTGSPGQPSPGVASSETPDPEESPDQGKDEQPATPQPPSPSPAESPTVEPSPSPSPAEEPSPTTSEISPSP